MRLGIDTPRANSNRPESAIPEKQGTGPAKIPLEAIDNAVAELNDAKDDGEIEFFEKDGVVHVRPTGDRISDLEG